MKDALADVSAAIAEATFACNDPLPLLAGTACDNNLIEISVWDLLTAVTGWQECGHDPEDDDALFSTERRQQHGPGLQAASAQEGTPSGTTLLAYDERMTLHEEDAASPHPERPDRIRAVIARLLSTGLAGAAPNISGCRCTYRFDEKHRPVPTFNNANPALIRGQLQLAEPAKTPVCRIQSEEKTGNGDFR